MPTIVLLNEKELLSEVAAGNEAAYKELFVHYWDHIYSTAFIFTKSRELAEDLAQDVFARVWVSREKLREVERFDAYLFITARNTIVDRLRRKVFVPANAANLADYFADSAPTPGHSVELKEMEALIHKYIDVLPVQQRTAFCLSRFQGLRHEEIARQMGISKESVKSYIVRAIYHLRRSLSGQTEVLPLFLLIPLLMLARLFS